MSVECLFSMTLLSGGGGGHLRGSALKQSSAAADRRYNKFTD